MRCKLLKLFIVLTFFLALCVNAAFCGEQEKAAFMRDGDIWIINGDGTGETRVTASGDCYNPQWSPDGTKIAYSRTYMVPGYNNTYTINDGTRNQIWIIDFAAGKEYKISNGFDKPFWSSDNELIFLKPINRYSAFITKKNLIDNTEVKLKEISSLASLGEIYLEMVSHEDKLIFYGTSGGRGSGVGIIDFDGKDITCPTRGEKYTGEKFADYNEDSNCLLLRVNDGMGTRKLYDLCIKNLTENKSVYYENFYDGKWSLDGKYIICVSRDNNLVKGHSGGTALTTSGDVIGIAAVTGGKIFYIRKSGKVSDYMDYRDTDTYYLWSIGLDGSSPERIAEGDKWAYWGRLQNIDICISSVDFTYNLPNQITEGNGIIPDSQYRLLTETDLQGLSAWELNIARNEIFARHGRPFTKQVYKDYFNSQPWYTENSNYQDSWLSDIEKANANFIKNYQDKTGLK